MHCMSKGATSFLTTRPVAEAWETVLRLLRAESFVQRKAAARIGVHDRTLYSWLKKHKFTEEVKKERAKMLAERVK